MIRAKQKQMKKASPKKKRKPPSSKASIEAITYKIVYENTSDSLGAIKLTKNEFESDDEYLKFIESYRLDPDFSPQNHLDLIDKFKNSKDKKKLRFTSSELKLLGKALHNSYSYLGASIDYNFVRNYDGEHQKLSRFQN